MRWIHDLQTITLEATGGADTALVTMALQDRAFRELTIWGVPGSGRVVGDAPGVRNFTYQVFFGPTSQAAAAPRVTDEIFFIYDPGDTVRIWPPNDPTTNLHRLPRSSVRGFPVSVQIINLDADPLILTLEFLALTIDQG